MMLCVIFPVKGSRDRSPLTHSTVEELRRLSSRPKDDAPELFRRMIFDALISNSDDHPRNHAVLAMTTDWKLSPAYDLTPSTPISANHRDLALECGDMGRFANAENLLTQCERFYLSPNDAGNMIDQMQATVRDNWYAIARKAEVTEKDCKGIAAALTYPGFRLQVAAD